jgi:hypothetical protein
MKALWLLLVLPLQEANVAVTVPMTGEIHCLRSTVNSADIVEYNPDGRPGYRVVPDALRKVQVHLHPFPGVGSFEELGVEVVDVRPALAALGISEDTFDHTNNTQRAIIGKALVEAAQSRFRAQGIHLADLSAASGGASYGDATLRSTAPGAGIRSSHHVLHVDNYLPGIGLHGAGNSTQQGAQHLVDKLWRQWGPDIEQFNMTKEAAVACIAAKSPGIVNVWVSLTKGVIEQEPVIVGDKRTLKLTTNSTMTIPIKFPNMDDSWPVLTVLRDSALTGNRWLYRPNMRFGEAFIFSNTETPHTAAWLVGQELKARSSAEIRLLMKTSHCVDQRAA